jgi:hypothetical protein
VCSRVGPLCFTCPLSEYNSRIPSASPLRPRPPHPCSVLILYSHGSGRFLARRSSFSSQVFKRVVTELLQIPAHQSYACHLWTCSPFFQHVAVHATTSPAAVPRHETTNAPHLMSLTPLTPQPPRLSRELATLCLSSFVHGDAAWHATTLSSSANSADGRSRGLRHAPVHESASTPDEHNRRGRDSLPVAGLQA